MHASCRGLNRSMICTAVYAKAVGVRSANLVKVTEAPPVLARALVACCLSPVLRRHCLIWVLFKVGLVKQWVGNGCSSHNHLLGFPFGIVNS